MILKGNTYVSRTKARKFLEEMDANFISLQSIFDELEQRKIQDRLESFVRGYRLQFVNREDEIIRIIYGEIGEITDEEMVKAEKEGIFESGRLNVNLGFLNGSMPDELVEKIVAKGRYANNSKGHKINSSRKRKKKRNKRKSGGGFSFKPEIAYLNKARGVVYLNEDYGGPYSDDDLSRPRYDRKNHTEQTLSKIEWSVVREWRSRYRNMSFVT